MRTHLVSLFLGLAVLITSAHAQSFENNPGTSSGAFFTSDGVTIDTSANHFNGDTPGLLTSYFSNFYGTGLDLDSRPFSVYISLDPNGVIQLDIFTSLEDGNTLGINSFELLVGGLTPRLPGLRTSGFTITSQTGVALGAEFDFETGIVTIKPTDVFAVTTGNPYSLVGSFETAPIPEPATVALGLGAAAGLVAVWRRRRGIAA